MVRKAIIVVLTLAALLTAYNWRGSRDVTIRTGGYITERHWLSFDFRSGHLGVDYRSLKARPQPLLMKTMDLGLLGVFEVYARDAAAGWRYNRITVPLWFPLLLFASYPTLAFVRGPLCRWRRRRKGLCLKCGYNLTGNVSGMCPECGTDHT